MSQPGPVTADVAVIGGGLHGCSAALQLAMCGRSVVVLEKDHVGRHASGVNAGGVRRLGRDFAEVPMAQRSWEMWQDIQGLVDDDCRFETSGQVKVAETEDELAVQRKRVADLQALGFGHEVIIDQGTLRNLLPAVAPHCVGGIHVATDGHASPFHTTMAFAAKARALGVDIREGARVEGLARRNGIWRIETSNGAVEAPLLVNCAGAWGSQVAARLGEPVPLSAEAFMLMITAPMAPFCEPVVGAAGRSLSFKQFANGTVMVGGGHRGTADPVTNRTSVDMVGLAESSRTATAIFPVMATATLVRCWAGIEGETPDVLPYIGPSSTEEGAFHSFGFCGHGFQLGPVVGTITASLVCDGVTDLALEPFRIDRFPKQTAEDAA